MKEPKFYIGDLFFSKNYLFLVLDAKLDKQKNEWMYELKCSQFKKIIAVQESYIEDFLKETTLSRVE